MSNQMKIYTICACRFLFRFGVLRERGRKRERRIINQKKAVKQKERCSYILFLLAFFHRWPTLKPKRERERARRGKDKVASRLLNNDKTNLKCIYIYLMTSSKQKTNIPKVILFIFIRLIFNCNDKTVLDESSS